MRSRETTVEIKSVNIVENKTSTNALKILHKLADIHFGPNEEGHNPHNTRIHAEWPVNGAIRS